MTTAIKVTFRDGSHTWFHGPIEALAAFLNEHFPGLRVASIR